MGTKRRRHLPDQIIHKLAEGQRLLAGGQGLDEVCRRRDGLNPPRLSSPWRTSKGYSSATS